MTKLSKAAIQQLLEAMAATTEETNPFDLDGQGHGKLKFDAISVEAGTNSAEVSFWFDGKKVYSMRFDPLVPGQTLRLAGIEGAMDFSVSN